MNRREFLETTGGAAALAFSRPAKTQVAATTQEVDRLFDRAIVVDTCGEDEIWDEAGRAALNASGYTAMQVSLRSGPSMAARASGGTWSEGYFETAMEELKEWRSRLETASERLLYCTKAADIERAKRDRKVAIILGFQNAPFRDDVDNIDRLYEAGCRCVQLTYNSRNNLGDGCTERLQSGLSDFGIACVERMDALGMIVDLSHCGEGTTADGVAFARRPCVTHTVCQALHFHPRGKSDALLRAVADKGGVVGICMVGYFLTPNDTVTMADYLNHIDHAVKVCGIDQVGMATDVALRGSVVYGNVEEYQRRVKTYRHYKPNNVPRWTWSHELDPPDRFRLVAHGLATRGYTLENIEKILGRNWLTYFREVFKG